MWTRLKAFITGLSPDTLSFLTPLLRLFSSAMFNLAEKAYLYAENSGVTSGEEKMQLALGYIKDQYKKDGRDFAESVARMFIEMTVVRLRAKF